MAQKDLLGRMHTPDPNQWRQDIAEAAAQDQLSEGEDAASQPSTRPTESDRQGSELEGQPPSTSLMPARPPIRSQSAVAPRTKASIQRSSTTAPRGSGGSLKFPEVILPPTGFFQRQASVAAMAAEDSSDGGGSAAAAPDAQPPAPRRQSTGAISGVGEWADVAIDGTSEEGGSADCGGSDSRRVSGDGAPAAAAAPARQPSGFPGTATMLRNMDLGGRSTPFPRSLTMAKSAKAPLRSAASISPEKLRDAEAARLLAPPISRAGLARQSGSASIPIRATISSLSSIQEDAVPRRLSGGVEIRVSQFAHASERDRQGSKQGGGRGSGSTSGSDSAEELVAGMHRDLRVAAEPMRRAVSGMSMIDAAPADPYSRKALARGQSEMFAKLASKQSLPAPRVAHAATAAPGEVLRRLKTQGSKLPW